MRWTTGPSVDEPLGSYYAHQARQETSNPTGAQIVPKSAAPNQTGPAFPLGIFLCFMAAIVIFIDVPLIRALLERGRSLETQGRILAHDPYPSPEYAGVTYYKVTYEYQVGPTTYTSNRISLPLGWSSTQMASLNKTYPVGSTVCVHYSPNDPATAFVDPHVPFVYYGISGVVVILTVAAAMVKLGQRSKQSNLGANAES